jgi:hypothetical protein
MSFDHFGDKHVVILINYMRVHHVAAFREIRNSVGKLTVLVSTPMEADRYWDPDWSGLDVRVQKNWTITCNRSAGYQEKNFIHIPWDTLGQLRELKPDVIMSYEMGMRTLFCAAYRMFNRTPLVMVGNMTPELENRRGWFRKKFRSFIKNRVDLCTYNGPSCREYLRSIGVDDSRLVYFPYSFDEDKVYTGEKEFSTEGVRRILYSGVLSERKAIEPFSRLLAEYCDQHQDQRFEYVIAGDGPYRDRIRALSRPNLKMTMLGQCQPQQLRECYRQADVCVFPTYGDEWGLVAMEAWASGVPVLGSIRAQSVQSVCRENENGWKFDAFDEEGTRRSIAKMLQTPAEKLRAMSGLARESVRQFTPGAVATQFAELMRRALNQPTFSDLPLNQSPFAERPPVASGKSINGISRSVMVKKPNRISTKIENKTKATLSLDLDNLWAYLKAHNDPAWESLPSYFDRVVPRILDVLDNFNLKITFFVVGQDAAIKDNRDALRAITQRGHEIANHSFYHEPKFHLYSWDRLQQEFDLSEAAILNATGQRTRGFRGPGFSISDQTLKTLVNRGYVYDSTIFPTFMGPLARTYYFMTGSFSSQQRRDRQALFGRLSDGFVPNRSFMWEFEKGNLLEIPVSTFIGLKVPIHATYLHYLATFSPWLARSYFSSALALYRLNGAIPSILLHPLDFLGGDDVVELEFFPGMKSNSFEKLDRTCEYLQLLDDRFEIVTMRQLASELENSTLNSRSIYLARPGLS